MNPPDLQTSVRPSGKTAAADRLRIQCHTSAADFPALAAEWDALHARSGVSCFFLSADFLGSWLRHFPDTGKLRLFTARDAAGRLVAAAPFAIMPGRCGYRRFLRHLTFIACLTDFCPEGQDILVDPAAPSGTAAFLVEHAIRHCRGQWDILHLPFLGSQSLIGAQTGILETQQHFQLRNSHVSAHVPLPDSWDAYLAALGTSFRKNLLKRWRNLEAAGTLELLEAGRDIPIPEALRELRRLHDLRFGAESTTFRDARALACHESLSTALAARGALGLLLLRFNGQCIAAGYDFLHDGTVWSFQSGWDPAYAARGIGHIMTACSIRWAISRGQHTYDFLAGEVEYKESWNVARRVLADYEASSRSTLRGLAYTTARSLVRTTRHAGAAACGAAVENAITLETALSMA